MRGLTSMTFGANVLCPKYCNYCNCCLEASTFYCPICLLPLQTQCIAVSLASCQGRQANLIVLLLDVKHSHLTTPQKKFVESVTDWHDDWLADNGKADSDWSSVKWCLLSLLLKLNSDWFYWRVSMETITCLSSCLWMWWLIVIHYLFPVLVWRNY